MLHRPGLGPACADIHIGGVRVGAGVHIAGVEAINEP